MILVPYYYQSVRHESVIVTGLLTGPQGIGMLLVMPLAGRFSDRFGGGRCAGGRLAAVAEHDPARVRRCRHVDRLPLLGAGAAWRRHRLLVHAAMTAAFASLRSDQLSDATPQLNVVQRMAARSA